jgi:ribosomal protein L37AE/L43A
MNEKKEITKSVNVDPEKLLSLAVDKGQSVETIEKLLTMRRELKAEWSKEQYYKALSQFQKECPVINKDSKVDFKNKKGGRTKYNYASLDTIVTQVRDVLETYGFSYTIKTKQSNGQVTAICESHHVDGHLESTEFSIPIDPEAFMNAAQKVASALTYAKRYSFCNAFGIMTGDDDDDAQSAGEAEENNNPICPECQKNNDVIKSKYPPPEWYCLKCKKSFDVESVEIVDEGVNSFNIAEAKDNIIELTRPYQDQLAKEDKQVIVNIINEMTNNKSYNQDNYIMDLQNVQTMITNLSNTEA